MCCRYAQKLPLITVVFNHLKLFVWFYFVFFSAASANFTYLFPLEYQPRISVCQHLQVWWEEASLQIALYISGADLTYCAIILWFTGVLNGKIGLYFFAARAQQRAKLALIFSEASFESSLEHFHFDTFLVSSLDYTSRARSLILNDKKI